MPMSWNRFKALVNFHSTDCCFTLSPSSFLFYRLNEKQCIRANFERQSVFIFNVNTNCCTFHQHFMSSFFANFLWLLKYKYKVWEDIQIIPDTFWRFELVKKLFESKIKLKKLIYNLFISNFKFIKKLN